MWLEPESSQQLSLEQRDPNPECVAMTPAQITLVKTSWMNSADTVPPVAELFYAELFRIEPALKAMFGNDIEAQQSKFAITLTTVVEHLDNPSTLIPEVQALGARHSGYGVKDEHYEMVERALIHALRQSLGAQFDAATEFAWIGAYRMLADAMKTADIDELMFPS